MKFEYEPLEQQDDNDYYSFKIEEAIEKAKKDGFTVYRSDPTRLLLDLDNIPSLEKYQEVLPRIQNEFGLKEVERWRSKSGEGLHVIVSCDPSIALFPIRCGLQVCLGSDQLKESLALKMYMKGLVEPCVLFRPKKKSM